MPGMKHLWLTTLLFALCFPLHAQDNTRRDGNWWREQTPSGKITYMTGFFDGMGLGHNFAYWNNVNDKVCAPKIVGSYDFYSDKFLKEVTNIQLADGLDEFYKDYRNRSIRISDGVWLVLNSIAGTPQAELDKRIENFRKNVD
jgi:hypothetical protein